MTTIEDMLNAELALVRTMSRTRIGKYLSMGEFVLTHGRRFTPQPTLPAGIKCGKLRQCFKNAANIAIERDDLIYCEGYAAGIIPVMHAWLVDVDGNVIDPTWCRKVGKVDFMGVEYFGIPISQKYLTMSLLDNEKYALIDAWEAGYPMLKDEPEMFMHPSFK